MSWCNLENYSWCDMFATVWHDKEEEEEEEEKSSWPSHAVEEANALKCSEKTLSGNLTVSDPVYISSLSPWASLTVFVSTKKGEVGRLVFQRKTAGACRFCKNICSCRAASFLRLSSLAAAAAHWSQHWKQKRGHRSDLVGLSTPLFPASLLLSLWSLLSSLAAVERSPINHWNCGGLRERDRPETRICVWNPKQYAVCCDVRTETKSASLFQLSQTYLTLYRLGNSWFIYLLGLLPSISAFLRVLPQSGLHMPSLMYARR